MPLTRFAEELLDGGQRLLGYPVDASVTSIVRSHVCRALGLSDAWRAWCERPGSAGPTADAQEHEVELTFAWAMAVEYVHDLRREPKMAELRPLRDVAPALVANCKLVVSHVREKRPERYERMAIELEQRLGTERVGGRPQDLGDIDTFRFEVELLLRCAIDELHRRQVRQTNCRTRAPGRNTVFPYQHEIAFLFVKTVLQVRQPTHASAASRPAPWHPADSSSPAPSPPPDRRKGVNGEPIH
jgi:hypothetical protein